MPKSYLALAIFAVVASIILFSFKRTWIFIGEGLRIRALLDILDWKVPVLTALSTTVASIGAGLPASRAIPGSIMAVMAVGVAVAAFRGWRPALRPFGVVIEDDPGSDALNLRITNAVHRPELIQSKLFLHVVQEWDDMLEDFKQPSEFRAFVTAELFANEGNLPYKIPRRFQLVEFTNPAGPVIKVKGSQGTWKIPRPGTWKFFQELRWDGGSPYRFVKYVHWGRSSAPAFVHPWRVWFKRLPVSGESKGTRSLE